MWGHKAWLSSAVFVGVLISPALGADVAISGSILDNAKDPISAIAISATGMAPGNPTAEFLAFTDAAGVFTLVVPAGFTGLIRPARSGYQFSPLSRAYTSLTTNSPGQNFEATELRTTVVIRGVVKDKSDAGIAGVSVLLSNGNTYLTGSDGEFEWVAPGGQVHRTANVNPRAPGGAYFVDAMPTKDLAAGAWAVRIQWNSGTLLTVPFSLFDSTAVVPLAAQGLMANREVPREQ